MKESLGEAYPRVFAILGNDDPRVNESSMRELEQHGLWTYIHFRKEALESCDLYGYSFVPPTPFRLKDWERYDVSRFVDPGCVSPEEGTRTVEVNPIDIRYGTIKDDLAKLARDMAPERSVMIFHSPPYKTNLDRAPLDGMMVDYAPLDVHVGSIAIKEFIERRQPRLTGHWREKIGSTWSFNVSGDSDELVIVQVPFENPELAEYLIVTT